MHLYYSNFFFICWAEMKKGILDHIHTNMVHLFKEKALKECKPLPTQLNFLKHTLILNLIICWDKIRFFFFFF